MNDFWNAIWSLLPTVGVGLLFWFIIWVILKSDKTERRVLAEIEAEERAKRGLPVETPQGNSR